MDDAEGVRSFRGGVCGIPVRLRISQRAAPGTAYRARAFAARGEAACVFPRTDQGARASGWRAFGGGTFDGCGFMAGGFGESAWWWGEWVGAGGCPFFSLIAVVRGWFCAGTNHPAAPC